MDNRIPIIEEFYSIQGEGANSGKPAYFVRVGGCDLACKWCDSKESWYPKADDWIDIDQIIARILNTSADTVVVTGGEPLMYNFDLFTKKVKENNIKVMLETCGAHRFSGDWDWICLSPKKQKPPLQIAIDKADELKVVIFEDEHFAWAELCSQKVRPSCKLYLQPEWSSFPLIKNKIVNFVKDNPKWSISLQIHKFLKIQ